jgi:hypothetical protein
VAEKMVRLPSHKTEENGFAYEPPKQCHYCEAELRAVEWPEGGMGPYIRIGLPIPGIALYQCTKCSCIMGNIHAAANMQRLKRLQNDARVLRPHEGSIIRLSS